MPNRSGNDGTITRFGWKAQNKTIMILQARHNVEMSDERSFPQATDEAPACTANKSEPNDIFRYDPSDATEPVINNCIFYRPADARDYDAVSGCSAASTDERERAARMQLTDVHNPGVDASRATRRCW